MNDRNRKRYLGGKSKQEWKRGREKSKENGKSNQERKKKRDRKGMREKESVPECRKDSN